MLILDSTPGKTLVRSLSKACRALEPHHAQCSPLQQRSGRCCGKFSLNFLAQIISLEFLRIDAFLKGLGDSSAHVKTELRNTIERSASLGTNQHLPTSRDGPFAGFGPMFATESTFQMQNALNPLDSLLKEIIQGTYSASFAQLCAVTTQTRYLKAPPSQPPNICPLLDMNSSEEIALDGNHPPNPLRCHRGPRLRTY